ncbi:hypothetical protein KCP69_24025 [Salmonella enterica subsp. enterica]|nr:hypothetical protein KCP69_24025 [Salmonella enterica subsp. enterica]
MVTTLLCFFFHGAPRGHFAPMLALGDALLVRPSVWRRRRCAFRGRRYHWRAGTFAIAGMGALMAASVRAADGDCAGAGDDEPTPAHFANDYHHNNGATLLAGFFGRGNRCSQPSAHSGQQDAERNGEKPECACGREYLNELPRGIR